MCGLSQLTPQAPQYHGRRQLLHFLGLGNSTDPNLLLSSCPNLLLSSCLTLANWLVSLGFRVSVSSTG